MNETIPSHYLTKMILPSVKKIFSLEKSEKLRQMSCLQMIASESYAYSDVLKISSSVFTNKYAEGYAGKRYYCGCKNADQVEIIAIEECKKAFNCKFANVQSHSGSSANFSIYQALLNIGDTILSMDLNDGGHLTHGSPFSFVSKLYKIVSYKLKTDTNDIDYESLRELALLHKPRLIIAGGSSFSLKINFKKFREIADSVEAYLFADICHMSGLIISGVHDHCFPHAHVAMCTTHKQLRGPRGAVIMWNDPELSPLINRAVFPGTQGGPQVDAIAGKAIALARANTKDFKKYFDQVHKNAQALCSELINLGAKIVANKTDTHLLVIDVFATYGITGNIAADWLEQSNIIANKNLIPNDTNSSALTTSGIRLGTLSLTVFGFKESDLIWVAQKINKVLKSEGKSSTLQSVKLEIIEKLKLQKKHFIH